MHRQTDRQTDRPTDRHATSYRSTTLVQRRAVKTKRSLHVFTIMYICVSCNTHFTLSLSLPSTFRNSKFQRLVLGHRLILQGSSVYLPFPDSCWDGPKKSYDWWYVFIANVTTWTVLKSIELHITIQAVNVVITLTSRDSWGQLMLCNFRILYYVAFHSVKMPPKALRLDHCA